MVVTHPRLHPQNGNQPDTDDIRKAGSILGSTVYQAADIEQLRPLRLAV